MRLWQPIAACFVLAGVVFACGSRDRALSPPAEPSDSHGPGGGALFGSGGGGGCSDEGACGNETHAITFDAPNLYFIIDTSASMDVVGSGATKTRYELVRSAAVGLVRSLGPLINVGAALFPAAAKPFDACSPGAEVMPVTPGDSFHPRGLDGPTTKAFAKAIDVHPFGGTPIGPTLALLRPIFEHQPGRTVVLLVTDGGPNCNPEASCGDDECIPVLTGHCKPDDGCCEAGHESGGPIHCLDRPGSIGAIEALRKLGIDVYVIGIPDESLAHYEATLEAMAEAGGVAREGSPKYTRVDDLADLGQVFQSIAAEAIGCDFTVDDPPEEEGFTNVYFGCELVPFDPADGWTWTGDATVTLHGDACARLRTGKVSEVKIVTGCPTEKPR